MNWDPNHIRTENKKVQEVLDYMAGKSIDYSGCVGVKKAAPRHLESGLQRQCMQWMRMQYRQYDRLMFAVPNGGYRNAREAAIMKKEGIVAGVSDLVFLLARGGYHGLCIEMKYGKGRQSEAQKEFESTVSEAGYLYAVINMFDDFVKTVTDYIEGKIIKHED